MKKTKPKERTRQSAKAPSRTRPFLYSTSILGLVLVPIGFVSPWPPFAQLEVPSDGTLLPFIVGLIFVIILNALFVSGEASLQALKPSTIRSQKEDGRQRTLQSLFDGRMRFLNACRLGSLTMWCWAILLSFFPAVQIAANFRAPNEINWGAILLAGIVTSIPVSALNLVFGELIPKSFAEARPAAVANRLDRFIRFAAVTFAIPVGLFTWIAGLVAKRFGGQIGFAAANAVEEEIKGLVETAEESGELEEGESDMLQSVLEFGDTFAREIMTPRVDLDALPITSSPEAIIALIRESGHSRIPLYEGTDDQIIGFVHAKDLLQVGDANSIRVRSILRPVVVVPEGKDLHGLLSELRSSRAQMAVVQDDYGGTAGIVTIEDIVEELVGEIIDEYDIEENDVVKDGGAFVVKGKMNLYDVNEEIGSEFESEEFDTLGGYVFGLFGRQPSPGEEIVDSAYRFRVDSTDGRRIAKIVVIPLSDEERIEDRAQA